MTSRLNGASVLLIGEPGDEREMYAEALRMAGFCTLQAGNSLVAARLAGELFPSAIVITDGRLDAGVGVSLLKELMKEWVPASHPPVLLVTSHARFRDVQAVMSAGCDRVIVKPCPPEALIQALDEATAVTDSASPSHS